MLKLTRLVTRVLAATAIAITVPAFLAAGAGAQAQTFKDHETFDAAGAVFACGTGNITVTGGSVTNSMEATLDASGVFHITGTGTVHAVTAEDALGHTYTITGAGWFGGKGIGTDPSTVQWIVFTDTADFVIHDATGAAYAKVQAVEHLSPNGDVISFDFGGCEAP